MPNVHWQLYCCQLRRYFARCGLKHWCLCRGGGGGKRTITSQLRYRQTRLTEKGADSEVSPFLFALSLFLLLISIFFSDNFNTLQPYICLTSETSIVLWAEERQSQVTGGTRRKRRGPRAEWQHKGRIEGRELHICVAIVTWQQFCD